MTAVRRQPDRSVRPSAWFANRWAARRLPIYRTAMLGSPMVLDLTKGVRWSGPIKEYGVKKMCEQFSSLD